MSDAVNDLKRQARRREGDEIGNIRAMLVEADESAKKDRHSTLTAEERLDIFNEKARAVDVL